MTASLFRLSAASASRLGEYDFAVRRRQLRDESGVGPALDVHGNAKGSVETPQRASIGVSHCERLEAAADRRARGGMRRFPPVDDEGDRLAEARVVEIEDRPVEPSAARRVAMHSDWAIDAQPFTQRPFAQRSQIVRGDGEGHQAWARLRRNAPAAIAGEVLRRIVRDDFEIDAGIEGDQAVARAEARMDAAVRRSNPGEALDRLRAVVEIGDRPEDMVEPDHVVASLVVSGARVINSARPLAMRLSRSS